jgi:ABC-type nickel/cobalt efflux system permease component RcnA
MFGLDESIQGLGAGDSLLLVLVVALLLGLRHATDPDHLTAVSTLVLGGEEHGARSARRLGLAWGAGHATTLVLLGLPVILFKEFLPAAAEAAAEFAIGVVIVALAVRLLVRWRHGTFHVHPHVHEGGVRHAHPHVHELAPGHDHGGAHAHGHAHAESLGRSPRTAYGIGLVHGAGGSAGVGILLISAMPGRAAAVVALVLFGAATAVSMAFVSAAWGHALASEPVTRRLAVLTPVLATLSLTFGVWYGMSAVA